jgi:hypothetical protein
MRQEPPETGAEDAPARAGDAAREARLKAALRANLGRRKAQARARREGDAEPPVLTGSAGGQPDGQG